MREAGGARGGDLARSAARRDDVDGPPAAISVVGRGLHPWARLPLLVYPAHALALTLALPAAAIRTRRAISARWSSSTRHDRCWPTTGPQPRCAVPGHEVLAAALPGRRRPQPPRPGVRRRLGRAAGRGAAARRSTRPASRRWSTSTAGRRRRCPRRSSAGRRRRRAGSSSSPGSTTTAGRDDRAFGETEARRLRDSVGPGRARPEGLEAARAARPRPGRAAGRGRRRAARPALGDGRPSSTCRSSSTSPIRSPSSSRSTRRTSAGRS